MSQLGQSRNFGIPRDFVSVMREFVALPNPIAALVGARSSCFDATTETFKANVERGVILPTRVVEVPPLKGKRNESMLLHCSLQFEAVRPFFLRPFARKAVRFFGEVVVCGGHPEFVSEAIDQRNVDRGATGMFAAAPAGIGYVPLIRKVRPHLGLDGYGAVSVKYLQAKTLLSQVLLNPLQCRCDVAMHEGGRKRVKHLRREVARRRVPDLL